MYEQLPFYLTILFLLLVVSIYVYFRRVFSYWPNKGVKILNPRIPFGDIGSIVISKLTIGEGLKKLHIKTNGKFAGIYCLTYPAILVKVSISI